MGQDIYIISGLGADERVFDKIDFSGLSVRFVKWIRPLEQEGIEAYATRLIQQIQTPEPVLVGLSFGGIMAVEIARQIKTSQIILIASAKNKHEVPFYFRFAGTLNLHKIFPASLLKRRWALTSWFFGTQGSGERNLLQQILDDTDPVYLSWAIDKIISWSFTGAVENVVHIHGTRDRIFPVGFIKCDFKVKGGGHFMTLNKEKEIELLIRNTLKKSR